MFIFIIAIHALVKLQQRHYFLFPNSAFFLGRKIKPFLGTKIRPDNNAMITVHLCNTSGLEVSSG